MKRINTLFFAIIITSSLFLFGCTTPQEPELITPQGTKNESQVNSEKQEEPSVEDESKIESKDENGEEVETTEPQPEFEIRELTDEDYILPTEFGDFLDIRDADEIFIGNGETFTPDEAIIRRFFFTEFNGFTYMTKSRGITLDSFTHPYNEETGMFDVELPDHDYEYFKVSIGDTFGTLTVTDASTMLSYSWMSDDDILKMLNPHAYTNKLQGATLKVSFSGYATVSGYVGIYKNIPFYDDGEICFLIDTHTWGDLPIIKFPTMHPLSSRSLSKTFRHSSDIHPFSLGKKEDYNGFDLNIIPDDGSVVYVSVVLSDIEISRIDHASGFGYYYGKIKSISLIPS